MKTDGELIAGLKAGDGEAARALVDTYGDQLLRLAYTITGNRQTAEDVVQDCLIRVCRKIDSFQGRSSLRTWVFRIAINIARNKTAQWWQRRVVLADAPIPPPDSAGASPEELAIRRESRREVIACLEQLPQKYQEVLVLYYLEEFSVAEISQLLSTAEGTVKSILSRGRDKLRSRLAPEGREAYEN